MIFISTYEEISLFYSTRPNPIDNCTLHFGHCELIPYIPFFLRMDYNQVYIPHGYKEIEMLPTEDGEVFIVKIVTEKCTCLL